MAMPISDANDLNTVAHWAMGHRSSTPDGGGYPVTDEDATDALRRLTGKAYRSLSAGLTPERVRLSATATTRERLLQIARARDLTLPQQEAFAAVLDVLDRVERKAAAAAGEGDHG